jgi:LPXTG-site transpeptidase (sortase) family protein
MSRRAPRWLTAVAIVLTLAVVGAAIAIGLGGWPRSDGGVAAKAAPASPGVEATQPTDSDTPGLDRIRIDRLGIDLAITEGDGIDAPLDSAAHYPGSGWPGDGTNIYIYGHAREGLFIRLKEARIGDRVVLAMADGSTHVYDVAVIVPDAPWDAVRYVDPTPNEQLTLQTSTSEEPADPRFIVIAYPAS